MRSSFAIGFVAVMACAPVTTAQHQFDMPPLPAGFPGVLGPGTFSSDDALAVTDGTSIFVLTGLRDPASFGSQVITPSGPQAMATHWCSLGWGTAVYRSTSGELILIRGLPASPTFVPSGVFDPNPCWLPVNPTTAVRLDRATGQATVLRHGVAGASLHVIQSPVPLAQWSTFGAGPSGADRFLAIGGNINRELVIFSGLSADPSGFGASTYWVAPPGTTGNPLHGFFVTPSGTGVGWEHTSLTSTELSLVRFGTGVPSAVKFAVAASIFDPGGGLVPFAARGDNIVLGWVEDLDPLMSLVIGADDSPQVVHSWYEGGWPYGTETVVFPAPDELLELDYSGALTHHVFSGPNAGSQVLPWFISADLVEAFKPNPDTVVTLEGGGQAQTYLCISTELHAGATAVPTYLGTDLQVSLIPLGRGRVAMLRTPAGGSPALSVLSLPTACDIGGTDPASSGVSLVPWPGAPRIGDPFELRVWAHVGGAEPSLAIATALGPDLTPGPPFAPGSLIDLEFTSLLGILPSPLLTGSAASPGLFGVDFGLESAPLQLAGFTFYVQAFQLDGNTWYVSNTLLVIPG